jgi:hypothetical protein
MLPVEDDGFDVLCGKAGGVVGTVAGLPFAGLAPVDTLIIEAADAVATQFSDWFCGSGGTGGGSGQAPGIPQMVEHYYPTLPSVHECQENPEEESDTNGVCDQAEVDGRDAKPDEVTGACQRRCAIGEPYELNTAAARSDCDPSKIPAPIEYWYQEQTGTVAYEWNGEIWVRGETRYDAPEQKHTDKAATAVLGPPCGPEGTKTNVAAGYNLVVHPNNDVNETNPVCRAGGNPPIFPQVLDPEPGDVVEQPFKQVTHILGCRVDFVENARGSNAERESPGADNGPKKVKEGATLGDEHFQIRTFARREGRAAGPRYAVRAALWGKAAPADELPALEQNGRYSIAQAEFFYDGTKGEDADDRTAWMWSMKWRGRLKRFRYPTDDDPKRFFEDECLSADGESGAFLDTLRGLGNLVMH